jgi:hypothetical protein
MSSEFAARNFRESRHKHDEPFVRSERERERESEVDVDADVEDDDENPEYEYVPDEYEETLTWDPADVSEVNLEEWDPDTMPDDATCLLIGARHSGKSVLLTDIMFRKRKSLDLALGMNPTEDANETLTQFLPPCLIFSEFDNPALRRVIEWQLRSTYKDKQQRKRAAAGRTSAPACTRRIGLILDDCMTEKCTDDGKKTKTVMKSDNIEKVFKLGRHWKLFFMACMQYIKDAPPSIRGNIDYLFVFDTNSQEELRKLHANFFGMFTFADFKKVFRACVGQKYNCCVLDVRASRGCPGKGIYYYCAKDRTKKDGVGPAFKVGARAFWELSDYFFVDRADYELDPDRVRELAGGSGATAGVASKGGAGAPAPLLKQEKSKGIKVMRMPSQAAQEQHRREDDRHKSRERERERDGDRDRDRER